MCSTLQCLGRTTLALLLVVALPQSARASFIDLVSQSYLIHARGSGASPEGPDPVVDYTETSGTPTRHANLQALSGDYLRFGLTYRTCRFRTRN
jgi:hypothetical protein